MKDTNKNVNRIGTGHYERPDGSQVLFVPVESENLSWLATEYNKPVELTEKEIFKAKMLNWDLIKVLTVKKLLLKGDTPSKIFKDTGISRNSIYKYKEVLKYSLIAENNNKSTENTKCVFNKMLIFSYLGVDSTPGLLLLCFLLFIAYFFYKYDLWKKERVKHNEEATWLHFQFTKVFDLSYLRYPILCNSEEEARHYRKLLAYYNNKGRDCIVLERGLNQNSLEYFEEKESYSRKYCSANRYMIKIAKENYSKQWDILKDAGKFDYFYYSNLENENWQCSKDFLNRVIKFYIDNPVPMSKDKARQKKITDLIYSEQ